MQLDLIRQPSRNGCTLSTWFVDQLPVCVGIEDVVRGPAEPKVFGKTAIPAGSYRVLLTYSNRFQRVLPLLTDLPGHRTLFGTLPIGECGVRIHPGNTSVDSTGCLLPGTTIGTDRASVLNSRAAFERLFARIEQAEAINELITLTIR